MTHRWVARLAALLPPLLLGACKNDSLVFVPRPDAPADVAWVAVLVADSGGALLTATGLQPWAPGRPLRIDGLKIPESATLELVGWTDAEVRQLQPPSTERLAQVGLEEATGCAPVLPAATWSARFDQAGSALPLLPTARRLTVDWLSASCPDLSETVSVDVRCMVRACAGFTQQEGCTLTVDLDNCTEGVHRATVDWRGQLCGIESSKAVCSFTTPRAPAVASIDCTEPDPCTIDVYVPPAEPAFTVDTVPVLSGVRAKTPAEISSFGVRAWAPFTGYTSGLTFQGGRVTVSTHDGRFLERPTCSDPRPTRTLFLDPDTLEQVGQAETPPCLDNLLAVPGASGFFGVSGSTKARALVELDENGAVLREHPLQLPDPARYAYDDIGLRLARDGRRFFVLLRWYAPNPEEDPHGSIIIELERGTFAQRTLHVEERGIPWGFAETDDGILAIADEDDDALTLIDAETGRAAQTPITLFHVSSISAGNVAWFQPTRMMLLPIAFTEELMHVVSVSNVTDEWLPFYEKRAGPLVTAPWPADPEQVLTGAAYSGTGQERDAWVALFEPRKRRFLPGAMHLGYGIPGQMLTEAGRVWITLPWEGSVARVTPR